MRNALSYAEHGYKAPGRWENVSGKTEPRINLEEQPVPDEQGC